MGEPIKKRKLNEEGVVSLSTTCNAVIKKNFPLKMLDPGSFTIPYTVGDCELGKALCESRESFNLMALFVVKRLSLVELTPTTMTL